MWEVRAGATILIYAPHDVLSGKRTLYTKEGSQFDHKPYKEYVTKDSRLYHDMQVRTPSQVRSGRSDVPEFAWHDIILDDRFVLMNRNSRKKRCYALVKPEDIKFVSQW